MYAQALKIRDIAKARSGSDEVETDKGVLCCTCAFQVCVSSSMAVWVAYRLAASMARMSESPVAWSDDASRGGGAGPPESCGAGKGLTSVGVWM